MPGGEHDIALRRVFLRAIELINPIDPDVDLRMAAQRREPLGRVLGVVALLAALLTVIGYSVNDSVVVFDRVRELRGQRRRDPFARVVGAAVLQTLPRTVNTGIGVLFALGALLLLGDGSLADFALALLLVSSSAPCPPWRPPDQWRSCWTSAIPPPPIPPGGQREQREPTAEP